MKGLYIHLPFCKCKCPYCGFYSETDSYAVQEKYFQALVHDLRSRNDRRYDTLYIGGGTPSTVSPDLTAAFLDWLSVQFQGHFAESTIEANPESVTDDFLQMVHRYGFTRISLGCQSTSDEVLSKLGRIHTATDIYKAVVKIRKICPDISLNLDMIFDIPGTDSAHTIKTISDITAMNPEHISAYTYSHDREFLKDTDDETDFMKVREMLTSKGWEKYEISNFAKPKHESKHNINYWCLGDYDGAGASAWSLENLPGKRILKGKPSDISRYIDNPQIFEETEETHQPQISAENLIFGLRMTAGVDIDSICINSDAEFMKKLYNSTDTLVNKGLIQCHGSKISLSLEGELYLDFVQSYFWERLT